MDFCSDVVIGEEECPIGAVVSVMLNGQVASLIRKQWKLLAWELQIDTLKMDKLAEDLDREKIQIHDVFHSLLSGWIMTNGKTATMRALLSHLEAINWNKVSEDLSRKFVRSDQTAPVSGGATKYLDILQCPSSGAKTFAERTFKFRFQGLPSPESFQLNQNTICETYDPDETLMGSMTDCYVSYVISSEEHCDIMNALGSTRHANIIIPGSILVPSTNYREWRITLYNIPICIVEDNMEEFYFIQAFNPKEKQFAYRKEITKDFNYLEPKPGFLVFEDDHGYIVGVLFNDTTETRRFSRIMQTVLGILTKARLKIVDDDGVIDENIVEVDDNGEHINDYIVGDDHADDIEDRGDVDGGYEVDDTARGDGCHEVLERVPVDGGDEVGIDGGYEVDDTIRVDDEDEVDDAVHVDGGDEVDDAVHVDGGDEVDDAVHVDGGDEVDDAVHVDGGDEVDDAVHVNGGDEVDAVHVDGGNEVDDAAQSDIDSEDNEEVEIDGGHEVDDAVHVDAGNEADDEVGIDGSDEVDDTAGCDIGSEDDEEVEINGGYEVDDRVHVDGGNEADDEVGIDRGDEVDDAVQANDGPEVDDTVRGDGGPDVHDTVRIDGGIEVDDAGGADDGPEVDDAVRGDWVAEVDDTVGVDGGDEVHDAVQADDGPEVDHTVRGDGGPDVHDTVRVDGGDEVGFNGGYKVKHAVGVSGDYGDEVDIVVGMGSPQRIVDGNEIQNDAEFDDAVQVDDDKNDVSVGED